MTVAAADNALVGLADAKTFLHVTGASQDNEIQALINRASDFCEAWCARPIKKQEFIELRLRAPWRSPHLSPPATPISVEDDVTLSLGGVVQAVWRTEDDGDPSAFDVMVAAGAGARPGQPTAFYRPGGWSCFGEWLLPPWHPEPVLLSYTGGVDPVPGEIQDACLLVVQIMFRQQEHQTTDVAQFSGGHGLGGVVSYRDSLIPMRAKQALDGWRVVPV